MPDTKPNSADLHSTAQHWVVLLTSGDVAPADIAAARAWCAEDPAHQQAFIEARRLWQLSGHLQAPKARQRPTWRWAAAAVLLLALCLGLVRQQAWDADYRTARGEQQRIELADGSHILLDSNSALDVNFNDRRREITLRKGEALFEVAHDPQRPFEVQTGELSATALGTVYAVRKQSDGALVTVARGRVAVTARHASMTLGPGEQIRGEGGALGEKNQVDTSKTLAWQHGRLVFEMAPLADVLAELQRYRPGYLLIGDDSLRALKVSGTFRLDRLDDALSTLEQAFPLKIQRYTDYLLVMQPR